MAEFDTLGADEFLGRYGFGDARRYFLAYEGSEYPSKAIVGVAHGLATGTRLRSVDFTGGEASVGRLLVRLGFHVRRARNPPWTYDEVLLAADLVVGNGWRELDETDTRVIELSGLLRRLPTYEPHERNETFRNASGVARKTADIATHHPDYQGKPTHGGKVDLEVIDAFISRPADMHAMATAVRAAAVSGLLDSLSPVSADDDFADDEGRRLERLHQTRERSRRLRRRKIRQVLAAGDRLTCEACGFDYVTVYGDRGAGYIECHHTVPLHVAGESTTVLKDLALVCANCHRMIHARPPWLTMDQLRQLIASHRDDAPTEATSDSPSSG